jgi:vitamin K-dependent gamma-carboxylase
MTRTEAAVRSALSRLERPVDGAGLAATRSVFGLVLLLYTTRFILNGWVDDLYVKPTFHFTYDAFQWIRPLPRLGMYGVFAGMLVTAAGMAVGYRARLAACGFGILFTYVELIDKAAYLNHYYLVSLVCGLFACVPSGERDTGVLQWRAGDRRAGDRTVPTFSYWTLRAQLVIVYGFAGVAKLNGDWLLRGEPLYTWLQMFADTPVVGGWLSERWFAIGASFGGAVFDLAVGPALLWAPTRGWAYLAAFGFHGAIAWLFPVGAFSWVMLALDLAFFAPDWPRRLRERLGGWWPLLAPDAARVEQAPNAAGRPRRGIWLGLLAVHFGLQLVIPLRFLAYPGPVNWTEEGFRFAWRVMLIEKTGSVRFYVVGRDGRRSPADDTELTRLQRQQMSTQPDMIHEYAQRLRHRYQQQGWGDVQVFAEAWASLNGRPARRLIRQDVDLAALPRGGPASKFVAFAGGEDTPDVPP